MCMTGHYKKQLVCSCSQRLGASLQGEVADKLCAGTLAAP